MIKHTARSAAAGMRAAAGSAVTLPQAKAWTTAARSLEEQRRRLSAEYCRLLERHLRDAIDELEAVDLRRLNRDALSALAQRQSKVTAQTEPVSQRLQQRVLPLTEQRLTVLDSHISAALGLQTVRPDINPFRPEILCNALAELMACHMDKPEELALWLAYLAPPYAGGLKRLYIDLVQIMQSSGVADARFQLELAAEPAAAPAPDAEQPTLPISLMGALQRRRVAAQHPRERAAASLQQQADRAATEPAAPAQATSGARSPRVPFPGMQQLARVFPGVSREVVRAFLHDPNWAKDLDAPLPPSYFHALEQTAAQFQAAAQGAAAPDAQALREFHRVRRQQSPVDRAGIELDLNHWLASDDWGEWQSPVRRAQQVLELKQEATRISEVMGLDCVGVTLTQLAMDTSLLWPVREVFLALSSPLVQLGVQQPWFLAKAAHPARAFIEAIAQKSYEYNDEYAEVFQAFIRPVQVRVHGLLALQYPSADDLELAFALALQQLQAAWDEAEHAAQGPQAGLKALQFAQDRQALANQFAAELAEVEAIGRAPEAVVKLMLETWSLVLAHAKLTDDRQQRDPGGYRVAGMDLVWSLSGEAAVNHPVRAFALLPPALVKLREGMDLIGATPQQIETTLAMLLPLHRRLLEMRRRKLQREAPQGEAVDSGAGDSLPSMLDGPPAEDGVEARLLELDDRTPWMSEAERSAAGMAVRDSGSDQLQEPGKETQRGALGLEGLTLPPDSGAAELGQLKSEAELLLQNMREQDWFDLFSHGNWQRVQLVWCNDNRSLFMFRGRTGSPHSMTRRICLKLMQHDQLRAVRPHLRRVVSVLEAGQAPDTVLPTVGSLQPLA
ncbi:DUF1631 family protein [Comamonas serinivorans]|nr:DUF1631 family protein [Comamonas serinivorans]